MAATNTPSRQFVPQDLDASDWFQIEPLFVALRERSIDSTPHLERWLLDFSELMSVLDEDGVRRYIDKSCHTDDPEIEKRFLHYVEQIEPKIKPLAFALQKRFLESPHRSPLTGKRYFVLARQWQTEVDIYRDENVPLQTEITRLVNEYDKTCGAMMIQFRGQEYTPQQMMRFNEETDRATREEAWRATTQRQLQDREKISQLFDQVLAARHRIARNAGFEDFRGYIWRSLKRFDYTPDDCLRFADAIEESVMPLVHKLDRQRAADLKLQSLRPWDFAVDPVGRPPLRPFDQSDIDGFVGKTRSIFQRLSPNLADDFDSLNRNHNLDLGSRKGKQPGGYQSTLEESRQPFIFMNAAGVQRDVDTLLHEAGHAFHALASADEPLMFLRSAPIEFCEVASMAMELFGAEHLDVFYDAANHTRARRKHLEGIIRLFPWIATIDLLQHWLYTHPGHTRDERTAEWLRLRGRLSSRIDWSGLEELRATAWQQQLHLFHVPFYYVEYAIAQLGALQLWMKAKDDPQRALSNYRAGLKLGGTRPLPELFSAAGIRFDFSKQTLKPLMDAVSEEIESLSQ
jgi:oligoendopeptidase F